MIQSPFLTALMPQSSTSSKMDTIAFLLLFVNLVAIVILSRGKCGLSKCITRYLVGMAAADLLVVITDVLMWRIVEIYFPVSFLTITPVCRLILNLSFAVTAASVWFTVVFTFDRFVAICCQKLKTKYCTEKTAAVVIGVAHFSGQSSPQGTPGPQQWRESQGSRDREQKEIHHFTLQYIRQFYIVMERRSFLLYLSANNKRPVLYGQ
ncbi:probable G-protein coupled receptor 139 [Heptranchias perlo]|uniref:probable G-protein coupled receptor 139 n=1 Tax=Heptranchias perlo TaxID=212740 RepID=UPI00355A8030